MGLGGVGHLVHLCISWFPCCGGHDLVVEGRALPSSSPTAFSYLEDTPATPNYRPSSENGSEHLDLLCASKNDKQHLVLGMLRGLLKFSMIPSTASSHMIPRFLELSSFESLGKEKGNKNHTNMKIPSIHMVNALSHWAVLLHNALDANPPEKALPLGPGDLELCLLDIT
ncbi:hypothetical protein Cgig2_010008 [Carnegiea gigantea]|uniref:Uncharacterized protein n=1 Tax=Carnegiea gigantea TaxID=171969 RepID=A0A9Q1JQF3_9CARY|nr:hypothetical protein Cgig2_010008 [Carnegiea gigantea]